MSFPSAILSRAGVLLGATLAGWLCCVVPTNADQTGAAVNTQMKPIVVRGKKNPETAVDAVVRRQVESAMESNPYFYSDHVMVTVRNGIAFLQGVVFDDWDTRAAVRITKKVAGVKRVINELEIGGQP